jgi:glycosyltransferase involved in cell wall biosynthesis
LRVLHITGDNVLGGVETMLVNLARFREHCPSMCPEFLMFPDGVLRERLLPQGVNVLCLGDIRLRWPRKVRESQRAFSRILKEKKYDVVVYHQYVWMPLIFDHIARRAGCASVRWFHNEIDRRHWAEIALRLISPKFPDISISCSDFLRQSVASRGSNEVLYHPIPPSNIVLSPAERRALRQELATSPDAVVVIQVSRMGVRKGHVKHLQALARLRDDQNWTCWMVGGAYTEEQREYEHSLKKLAAELKIADRVRFTGARSDISRLLAAADVFCQPNTPPPEPFGIVFVEALYAGLPIVTSAMGGALEIVDPSSGILVPPDDVETLAHVLRQLLAGRNAREKFRLSGPARARQLCDPGQQIAKLGAILGGIRGSKPSSS